jgi:serine/threonine-protein kinase HipA
VTSNQRVNRTGYVYCRHQYVGEIVEYISPTGYEYHFKYDAAYMASMLPRIGYNLIVTNTPYVLNSVHPFFLNLMSEGWVKRHQAAAARLDMDDNFGLLLGHGQEIIGPINIQTEFKGFDKTPAAGLTTVPIESLKGFSINFPRSEFNELARTSLGRVSISGVQPKMFLTYAEGVSGTKKLTNAAGMGPFIVKPSPADLPELAENEYMIMQLCRAVGFKVAEHHLVPFSCGQMAYVTGRFDLNRDTGVTNEFIEDLASILNVTPGKKSADELSYERAIKAASAFCGGHVSVARNAFLQIVMAYIVGNNDLHLKNLSLQRPITSEAASGFTPIYDMVSVAPYRDYDHAGELSLWLLESETVDGFSTTSKEHYGYYTGHDFVVLAEKIGLGTRAGQALMNGLMEKVKGKYEKILAKSPGSESLKQAIAKRITERLAALARPPLS